MLTEEFLKREIIHAEHAFRALKIYFNEELTDEKIKTMIANGDATLPYGLEALNERRDLLTHAKSILNRNLEIPETVN